jgi:hypothetical protein
VVPAEVRVQVMSTPEGAAVIVEGEPTPRGLTPLSLTLPRGDAPRKIALRARGFQPYSTEVVPDANSRVQVTLTAVGPPQTKARPVHRAPPVKRADGRGPDVRRGDVVDPFAR